MEPITAPAAAPPLAPAHAPAAAPATFAPPSTAPRTTRSPVLRLGSPASSVQRSAKASPPVRTWPAGPRYLLADLSPWALRNQGTIASSPPCPRTEVEIGRAHG